MIQFLAIRKSDRPLGVILHEGTSPFADAPYVVIAVLGDSDNEKTGEMVQTYIIRSDMRPNEAVNAEQDEAICGGCPMRQFTADDGRKVRGCYVNVGQGPLGVYEAYRRGRYAPYSSIAHDRYFAGRMIRWGTYGEPVLIPLRIVQHLSSLASGWTGYTHAWNAPEFQPFRRYFMASVHRETGPLSAEHARHLHWRWFQSSTGDEPPRGSILCPASEEAGKRLQCHECGICNGARNDSDRRVSVYIPVHGGLHAQHSFAHIPALN